MEKQQQKKIPLFYFKNMHMDKKISCDGSHTTFAYQTLKQKKILLATIHFYLNCIMHALQSNELSALVFIVYDFSH